MDSNRLYHSTSNFTGLTPRQMSSLFMISRQVITDFRTILFGITGMNSLTIDRDTKLEPKVYILPEGITIDSDNVTLDGHGATIMGTDKTASHGIQSQRPEKHRHQKSARAELLPWNIDPKVNRDRDSRLHHHA